MEDNWIRVKDRLPQRLFSVILCDMDDNISEGFLNDGSDEFFINISGENDDIIFNNVTHWMNFPKPPVR